MVNRKYSFSYCPIRFIPDCFQDKEVAIALGFLDTRFRYATAQTLEPLRGVFLKKIGAATRRFFLKRLEAFRSL
jgi:hypothetical protein